MQQILICLHGHINPLTYVFNLIYLLRIIIFLKYLYTCLPLFQMHSCNIFVFLNSVQMAFDFITSWSFIIHSVSGLVFDRFLSRMILIFRNHSIEQFFFLISFNVFLLNSLTHFLNETMQSYLWIVPWF